MTASVRVAAVVLLGRARSQVVASAERQTRRPDELVTPHARTAAEALRAAPATWDWVWLLDGSAVPAPDALEQLLAPLGNLGPLPRPLVLGSVVTTSTGAPHPGALPEPELFEKEISIAACERRLVHVRALRPGSLLVAAPAVKRFGGPLESLPAPDDTLEWTARMLRSWDDPGLAVPASAVVRAEPAGPPSALPARARALLRSDSWSPRERLWNAYGLALEAAGRPSGATRRSPRPSRSPRATTATLSRLKRLKRR